MLPYEDVQSSWKDERETWSVAIVTSKSARELAQHAVHLMRAMTPSAINYYWAKRPEHTRIVKILEGVAEGSKADPRGSALTHIVRDLELKLLPPPPESELSLLHDGKPDELAFSDEGPDLKIGDKCGALDIRMMWCPATIMGKRLSSIGVTEYRVHYEGWKPRWDEWLARDSGRVRLEVPAPSALHKPTKTTSMALKVQAKAAAAAATAPAAASPATAAGEEGEAGGGGRKRGRPPSG